MVPTVGDVTDPDAAELTAAVTVNDGIGHGHDLEVGRAIGHYVISAVIAEGGCGSVYGATDTRTGARLAMKVLHRDLALSSEMVGRFQREVHAVNLIRHPNIVAITDFGHLEDGRPYYVMEFVDGSNLEMFVRRHGALDPDLVLSIVGPLVDALEAAHRVGVIHRDVKSSNILLGGEGPPYVVKLTDFGIAKLVDPGSGFVTTIKQRLGTPYAMAPEQIRGDAVDARTDVYAMGALLFQVLTGRHPFRGSTDEIEAAHLNTPPPRPSDISPTSPEIDRVVLRCLAKQPDQRYPSIRALFEDFQQAVSALSTASSRARSAQSIGIYADVRTDDASEDDALYEDLGQVLDMVDTAFREAGLLVALQTGNSSLGLKILSPEEADQIQERLLMFKVASDLGRSLRERANADSRIQVRLCLHVDTVLVRATADRTELAGPIVCVDAWVPAGFVPDVCATRQATMGIVDRVSAVRILVPEALTDPVLLGATSRS